MTYNVFIGTLNPTQSINLPTANLQSATNEQWKTGQFLPLLIRCIFQSQRVDSKSVTITAVLMPVFKVNLNQATGYASQYIWCLSQARIKWEGYGRKGIRHKNVGMMEMGR